MNTAESFAFLLQQWYSSSVKVICVWLADRLDLQLHVYQLKTVIKVVKVSYSLSKCTKCLISSSHCVPIQLIEVCKYWCAPLNKCVINTMRQKGETGICML